MELVMMDEQANQDLRLWYRKPAIEWEEALPFGNGRLGGMVFGAIQTEHLQLNEDSVWYGGPRNRNNPDALENLPQAQGASDGRQNQGG
jgi:alpha-L-fucosidase 2